MTTLENKCLCLGGPFDGKFVFQESKASFGYTKREVVLGDSKVLFMVHKAFVALTDDMIVKNLMYRYAEAKDALDTLA